MKKTISVCDKCKKDIEKPPLDRLDIFLERTYNGTDHDNEYMSLDLCHSCAYKVLKKFFDDHDGANNKALLKSVGLL